MFAFFPLFCLQKTFPDKLFGVPNFGLIFCIVLPIIFAHIKSNNQHSSCIWTHNGTNFWLLLLRTTGNSYCRSSSRMLYHYSDTESTNCAAVSVPVKWISEEEEEEENCWGTYLFPNSPLALKFSVNL